MTKRISWKQRGQARLPDLEVSELSVTVRLKGSMTRSTRRITILIAVLLMAEANVPGQKERSIPACKQTTFAAFKPLPKVEYVCPEGLIESDNKLLKVSERIAALRGVVKELEAFTNAAWWQAEVDDLNACKVHGSAGELTDEEKE